MYGAARVDFGVCVSSSADGKLIFRCTNINRVLLEW